MRPSFLIDAGHGGDDPGCHGNGLAEKDINLTVGKKLAQALSYIVPDTSCVASTRIRDITMPLSERAPAGPRTLTLVLHCDTSADPRAGHWRCYARADDAMGRTVGAHMAQLAPAPLADVILGPALVTTAVPTDWTHRAFNCLKYHKGPAVLVEMGFLSNAPQAAYLNTPEGQLAVVATLMAGCALAWTMQNHTHPGATDGLHS